MSSRPRFAISVVAPLMALAFGGFAQSGKPLDNAAVLGAIRQGLNKIPPKNTTQGSASGYPDELGVYYLKQERYVSIDPEVLSLRTTNALATMYSFGIKKMKVNGWVVGEHSKARFGSEIRDLFLDIPEGVSPNEYTLLKFVVKSNRREVELARSGYSLTVGTERSAIPFGNKKVEKGKYLITLKSLASGDYGFMPPGANVSASASSAGKVYTFQIVE